MLRTLLASTMLAASIAVPLLGACDATVVESCIGGPCTLPGSGSVGAVSSSTTTTTSSSTGGSPDGGTGGGPPLDAKNCPTIPKTGDFPCDVFAVVHSICNKCHTNPTMNGAPFQLLTYADTQQPYNGLGDCKVDADCGPTPGNCVAGVCKGLRFQQMFISTGPNGDPQMPFGEGMLPEPQYSTLHDWLGKCAPPLPAGTGCGCPGKGCN